MSDYLVLSITRAAQGRQEEMLRWYDGQHVPDLLAVEGFSNPRRFRMADTQLMPGEPQDQFITLFDLASDDVAQVGAAIQSRIGSGEMVISDAVGEVRVFVVEPIAVQSKHS